MACSSFAQFSVSLLTLMKSLIQLQPDVCQQALVPVLLAAYNATLSKQGITTFLLMLKYSFRRNSLSPNPTKRSNTRKQSVGCCRRIF